MFSWLLLFSLTQVQTCRCVSVLPHQRGRSEARCSWQSHTCHRCWAWTPELQWHILPLEVPVDIKKKKNKTDITEYSCFNLRSYEMDCIKKNCTQHQFIWFTECVYHQCWPSLSIYILNNKQHNRLRVFVYVVTKGSDLGVVELHGVIGGQRHHQAFLMELKQRVLGILKEQAIVAQWGHGDRDLGQDIQVLQHGALFVKGWGENSDFTSFIFLTNITTQNINRQ